MTKAGKIVVLANTVLSFIFLGMTTLVYSTRLDVRAEESQQNQILNPLKATEKSLGDTNKQLDEAYNITEDKKKDLIAKKTKAAQDAESNYQGLVREMTQVRTEIAELQSKSSDSQKALTQNREEVRKQEGNVRDLQAKIDAKSKERFEIENRLRQRTNTLNVLADRSDELARRVKELESAPKSSTGNRGE